MSMYAYIEFPFQIVEGRSIKLLLAINNLKNLLYLTYYVVIPPQSNRCIYIQGMRKSQFLCQYGCLIMLALSMTKLLWYPENSVESMHETVCVRDSVLSFYNVLQHEPRQHFQKSSCITSLLENHFRIWFPTFYVYTIFLKRASRTWHLKATRS